MSRTEKQEMVRKLLNGDHSKMNIDAVTKFVARSRNFAATTIRGTVEAGSQREARTFILEAIG